MPTITVACDDDISCFPNNDETSSLWDDVELSLGQPEDTKGGEVDRTGALFSFLDLGIPEPVDGRVITINSAYLELTASQTTTAPDNTDSYRFTIANQDGGWDATSPTVGDTLYDQIGEDLRYRIENAVTMKVGHTGDDDSIHIDRVPHLIPHWTATLGEDSTLTVPIGNTSRNGSDGGEVWVYFKALTTNDIDLITVRAYFTSNSGRDYTGEFLHCQVFDVVSDDPTIAFGVPTGSYRYTGGIELTDMGTTTGSDALIDGADVSGVTINNWYVAKFFLSTVLDDEDVIRFEGRHALIQTAAHFNSKTRTYGTNDATSRGFWRPPAYIACADLPWPFTSIVTPDTDSNYVNAAVDSVDPPVSVTAGTVYRFGNSVHSPDVEVDLASIIQTWVDRSHWTNPGQLALGTRPKGVDASASDQIQYFHSSKNTGAHQVPTLHIDFDVEISVAGESTTTSSSDASGLREVRPRGESTTTSSSDAVGLREVRPRGESSTVSSSDAAAALHAPVQGESSTVSSSDARALRETRPRGESTTTSSADAAGVIFVIGEAEVNFDVTVQSSSVDVTQALASVDVTQAPTAVDVEQAATSIDVEQAASNADATIAATTVDVFPNGED